MSEEYTEKTRARFWSKVDKNGPTVRDGLTPCWMWKAGLGMRKYGVFFVNRKSAGAHRVSWEMTNGSAGDLWVLHRCDNPGCVNPDHLFLGTHADNDADRHAKGRDARGARSGRHTKPESNPRGERHGRAKLTNADVADIRLRRSRGERLQAIASAYGVSDTLVSLIAHRRIWAHVGDAEPSTGAA